MQLLARKFSPPNHLLLAKITRVSKELETYREGIGSSGLTRGALPAAEPSNLVALPGPGVPVLSFFVFLALAPPPFPPSAFLFCKNRRQTQQVKPQNTGLVFVAIFPIQLLHSQILNHHTIQVSKNVCIEKSEYKQAFALVWPLSLSSMDVIRKPLHICQIVSCP